jgi:hypothetical protein
MKYGETLPFPGSPLENYQALNTSDNSACMEICGP